MAGGTNPLIYVGANPLSKVDPLGLEWQATIGISGIIGGNPIFGAPGLFGGGGMSIGITSSGQIIIQAQATGSAGVGIFAGVGAQGQVSKSKCPTQSGISVGRSVQGDANFGAGPSVGGSAQHDGNGGGGLSTGVGKIGVGVGAQASVGVTQTVTLATPALFPSSSSQCGCQ